MGLDVSLGNITQVEAERLSTAAGAVDDIPHVPGSTEPWISGLVGDFIIARGARTVLETGSFQGATSIWILNALKLLGGGTFHLCEVDPDRAKATRGRLHLSHDVDWILHTQDVLAFLRATTYRFDLAWVDDSHEKKHVEQELMLLLPKMNPGGLILLHDVFGSTDLKTVVAKFGGYSLDLPRLGPAGGLGIIQVPA